MRILAALNAFAFAFVILGTCSIKLAVAGFVLEANPDTKATTTVNISLEAGGNFISTEEGQTVSQPMNVAAQFAYHERMVAWSADSKAVARSVRQYDTASATIKYTDHQLQPTLPENTGPIVAEIRGGYLALNSVGGNLNRKQFDLVNVSGDSLALDRLLPGKEVAEGENWSHDTATIAPLLGMDHVAVCEVSSVVTGESQKQVQIRMAGTVHGTIDGAPTEIELRGAYLFHQGQKRITKFNLAIKENRSAGEVVPGLDTVAQLRITLQPASKRHRIDDRLVNQVSDLAKPVSHGLLFESEKFGFRLLHDVAWYITGEQSDLVSFRHLQEGRLTAHCNISSLPARSEGRATTLEEFERDVRASIGDNLKKVTASREWTTAQQNSCLGVVATGEVEGVAVQWRYYLIASPNKPRVSLAVTVEDSLAETFADADRQLVDGLVLGTDTPLETARRRSRTAR